MGAGQSNAPPTIVTDVEKGRVRAPKDGVLQRFDGQRWHEIGRFGSVRKASEALDEAVAEGMPPDTLRVVAVGPSIRSRILRFGLGLSIVILGIAVVWFLVAR